MIAVDTNILARFYCDDPDDPEAKRQRPIARRVMVESTSIFVPLTVVLEFEWVMRGFYDADPEEFRKSIEHLIGMPNVTVERWEALNDALHLYRQGLDFTDALHWACSAACERFITFDDRRFARRARRLGLRPTVSLPATG
jgi:predicted nucleic-acid-binding protein